MIDANRKAKARNLPRTPRAMPVLDARAAGTTGALPPPGASLSG